MPGRTRWLRSPTAAHPTKSRTRGCTDKLSHMVRAQSSGPPPKRKAGTMQKAQTDAGGRGRRARGVENQRRVVKRLHVSTGGGERHDGGVGRHTRTHAQVGEDNKSLVRSRRRTGLHSSGRVLTSYTIDVTPSSGLRPALRWWGVRCVGGGLTPSAKTSVALVAWTKHQQTLSGLLFCI